MDRRRRARVPRPCGGIALAAAVPALPVARVRVLSGDDDLVDDPVLAILFGCGLLLGGDERHDGGAALAAIIAAESVRGRAGRDDGDGVCDGFPDLYHCAASMLRLVSCRCD